MEKEETIKNLLDLLNRSTIAMLGTIGDDGYPNIMQPRENYSVMGNSWSY